MLPQDDELLARFSWGGVRVAADEAPRRSAFAAGAAALLASGDTTSAAATLTFSTSFSQYKPPM